MSALCSTYSVIRPYKPNKKQHPEEGTLEMVTTDTWHLHMNEAGQIEDDFTLRKVCENTSILRNHAEGINYR